MALLKLPGLIDCHVHFREPGLTHKEDMRSGAAAAKAGGVLTVCEMPNTTPPVVTVAALAEKVRIADKITDCDIRFFMGATEPRHLLALRDVWRGTSPALRHLRSRCSGLKLYLDHSTGDQGANARTVEEAFKLCGELDIPVVAHCEDKELNAESGKRNAELKDVSAHSLMRPPESEIRAIAHAITLVRKYSTRFHVAHLSTAGGLQLVRDAKAEGLTVTCEVTPHHLFLTTDDYKELGTFAKMNPPLRSADDRDALWEGIADGTVDCIATDHAPHTLEEKQSGNPLETPSGVPGVETMLPLLLTVAAGEWPHPTDKKVSGFKFQVSDIVRLCFDNPNRIFGLGKERRDNVIVDPSVEWEIHADDLHHKCGWTPYEGWKVQGKVIDVLR